MRERASGRSLLVLAVALGCLLSFQQASLAATVYPYKYSPQNGLLGLNETIWQSANYGAGITFAVIDTGVAAPWIGFQNRVSTGICEISGCGSSYDDNGHGTFVASEIVGDVRNFGLVGIAPAGTILPVKVLSAQGSGYVSDVARGITYAADNGANVMNLSMTFIPTADIVQAINYAASKNVMIVFAGGNSSANFLNNGKVSGFTDAAIQRMVFMGSTNLKQQLSYFSNRPGAGGFTSTTGKFYSFASRWMMADGESIWGASTYHTDANGYSYITQMSGTSMSAPQAAGAVGLLEARWPFLVNTGTAANILLASAQDMGTKGVDKTYGLGFMRIDKAFQPVGSLTVPVSGRRTSSGGSLVTGDAFGRTFALSSAFSDAVAYDDFSRDFSLGLSSAIKSASSGGSSSATLHVQEQTGAAARGFSDLGEGAWAAASFSGGAVDHHPGAALLESPEKTPQSDWSMGFQQSDGRYFGVGHGSNAALSFNDARWGGKTAFFNNDNSMAGNLLGLTSSANFAAVGMDISRNSRLAFGGMTSEASDFSSLSGQHPTARGAAISYTLRPAEGWVFSLSNSFLKEDNMLLGSMGNGYLSLGQASTMSFGLGASVDLGNGYNFGVDTIAASTSGTHNRNSLIKSTSHLTSAGFSMVLNKENLTGAGDNLGFTVKKPLRVYSGSAHVDVPTGTDSFGNPIIEGRNANLSPSGNETDFGVDYRRPLAPGVTSDFSFMYRQDADQVKGARDGAAMFHLTASF
jgi:hypothetical protein